jgi:hypothetical protein
MESVVFACSRYLYSLEPVNILMSTGQYRHGLAVKEGNCLSYNGHIMDMCGLLFYFFLQVNRLCILFHSCYTLSFVLLTLG